MRFPYVVLLSACALMWTATLRAQSPNGVINGLVVDSSSRAIVGADVVVVNDVTGLKYTAKTNDEGIYVLPNLPPGPYRLQVSKVGFKTIIKPDITLNVQDALSINFTLPIGALYETVTVEGGAPMVDTESAAVSTVVDRNFAENLPMNGRSFQTLIDLTPGVVVTPSSYADSGQFSVNGQRAASNYWMVDGVSANIGVGAGIVPGNGFGGTLGSFSALGGTNSLVSVDALQEFRIQTSTYAPEFGRTPGAQISIATRSGTNQYHGTVFDYLRNDILDANDWFANRALLPKPKERQNDFGGTLSGPILKDRTFAFFSYEGLRLSLPQVSISTVPDLNARQTAAAAVQPFLRAFPLPNGADDPANGDAELNASYSNPATLNAYSLRIDHNLSDKWAFFGRYNYSPSAIDDRGGISGSNALSMIQKLRITTETATIGATWRVSPTTTNDLRFNYSRTNAQGYTSLDGFAGASPLTALPLPSPYTTSTASFGFGIYSLTNDNGYSVGKNLRNVQRQINLVESLSAQRGSHSLKFGLDFRRLSPVYDPLEYEQSVSFNDVSDSTTGQNGFGYLASNHGTTVLFHNLGAFGQDTWHAGRHLAITYGVRWDVDFAPSTDNGPSIPAIMGYSLTDLSELSFAPPGTPPFKTRYSNLAPRLGVAYQVSQSQSWQTVFRGGFGIFYDLVSAETGNIFGAGAPPFGNYTFLSGTFPFSPTQVLPVPIGPTGTLSNFEVYNPNLKLPFTLQWNVALEQLLGTAQTISLSYVGAAGRRLLQTTSIYGPLPTNPNVGFGAFIDNTASSGYNALQVQFQRRLSHGLQALASYTWSHSIDDASASSYGNPSNGGVPGSGNANWGNSAFDVRHGFTAGLTYDVPGPGSSAIARSVLRGWSTENFIMVRSAPPVDIRDVNFFEFNSGVSTAIRPDVVVDQPLYLHGTLYPGGTAFNSSAFTNPPIDPVSGNPSRQGDLPRNVLRGFGAAQWDFAVHRDFSVRDPLKLQFRAEMFNVLNHPNFGPENNLFGEGGFGLSTQMLGSSLAGSGTLGAGGFAPLYQIGGPRSIQLALKLMF